MSLSVLVEGWSGSGKSTPAVASALGRRIRAAR